jgi:hypothetical protein
MSVAMIFFTSFRGAISPDSTGKYYCECHNLGWIPFYPGERTAFKEVKGIERSGVGQVHIRQLYVSQCRAGAMVFV